MIKTKKTTLFCALISLILGAMIALGIFARVTMRAQRQKEMSFRSD